MALIAVQVRLNDALAEAVVINEKTGEKWVNLSKLQGAHIYQNANKGTTTLTIMVADRQAPDQFGNTHSIYLQQSKEDRSASVAKKYCGDGKVLAGGNSVPAASTPAAAAAPSVDESLPF